MSCIVAGEWEGGGGVGTRRNDSFLLWRELAFRSRFRPSSNGSFRGGKHGKACRSSSGDGQIFAESGETEQFGRSLTVGIRTAEPYGSTALLAVDFEMDLGNETPPLRAGGCAELISLGDPRPRISGCSGLFGDFGGASRSETPWDDEQETHCDNDASATGRRRGHHQHRRRMPTRTTRRRRQSPTKWENRNSAICIEPTLVSSLVPPACCRTESVPPARCTTDVGCQREGNPRSNLVFRNISA